MATSLSILKAYLLGPWKSLRILVVGLDRSGKSVMLHQLATACDGSKNTTIPTIGLHVETLRYQNTEISSWEIGGSRKPIWRQKVDQLSQGMNALVFVVDSNDKDRIMEAADELKRAVHSAWAEGIPVLVFANKQDIGGALVPVELAEKMQLSKILGGHSYSVQASSLVDGKGLKEGLEWLQKVLKKSGHSLRIPKLK